MLDSRVSCHMVGDISVMSDLEKISPVAVSLPNGMYTMAHERGSANLDTKLKLNNVLFVPKLNCNLVSVSKLCKQLNCTVTFFDDCCVIQDRTLRTMVGSGEQTNGVYYYKKSTMNLVNTVNRRCLWHKRLRCPSSEFLSYLPNTLRLVHNTKEDVCEICLCAKQIRRKFSIGQSNVKENFDLIYCDIWGRNVSLCGAHYFLSIVDCASRGTWVYLMKDRSEASELLKEFILMVKTQFHKIIKVVRSDNGAEFTSGPMCAFYQEHGILRESSCVDMP